MNDSGMKMVSRVLAFAFLVFFLRSPAQASVLFDPYVGLPFGSWKNQRTTATYDMQVRGITVGIGYGARLAYSLGPIFAGLDYTQWVLQWKFTKVSNSSLDDGWRDVGAKQTSLGPILGFKTASNSFFLWFTYFAKDDLEHEWDIDPNYSGSQYKGSGYGVGIGFRFLKTFKLNGEYHVHTFDKWITNGSELTMDATSGGLTQKPIRYEVYVATISLPLQFW
jgi:hypothetical protein